MSEAGCVAELAELFEHPGAEDETEPGQAVEDLAVWVQLKDTVNACCGSRIDSAVAETVRTIARATSSASTPSTSGRAGSRFTTASASTSVPNTSVVRWSSLIRSYTVRLQSRPA
jgi:hypothetical protein